MALPNQDLLQRDNFKQLVRPMVPTASPSVRVIKATFAVVLRQLLQTRAVVGKEFVFWMMEERL